MYSKIETSEPNLLYTWPSSNPITPPPIIIKCLGISFSFNASVDVIILSLSTLANGKIAGLLPVAIIMFLDSIIISEDCELIFTCFYQQMNQNH